MEVVYTWWRYSGLSSLKDKVSYLKKRPRCCGPHSCHTTFSQPTPKALWGVPWNQLTEKEKTQVWFEDVSTQYAGTTQKWTAIAPQPISGTSLRDTCKGESSSGQNIEQWTYCITLSGRRNDQVSIYILIHRPWLMISLMVRHLEKIRLENRCQGHLGKKDVDRPIWMGKKCEDMWVSCWTLTKWWPQQRRIFIIKGIGPNR